MLSINRIYLLFIGNSIANIFMHMIFCFYIFPHSIMVKSTESVARVLGFEFLTLPFTSCVMVDKLLSLSGFKSNWIYNHKIQYNCKSA